MLLLGQSAAVVGTLILAIALGTQQLVQGFDAVNHPAEISPPAEVPLRLPVQPLLLRLEPPTAPKDLEHEGDSGSERPAA